MDSVVIRRLLALESSVPHSSLLSRRGECSKASRAECARPVQIPIVERAHAAKRWHRHVAPAGGRGPAGMGLLIHLQWQPVCWQTIRGHPGVTRCKCRWHRLLPAQARQPHRQREICSSHAGFSAQDRVGGQQDPFGKREALLYQQPHEADDRPAHLKDDTSAPEHIQYAI